MWNLLKKRDQECAEFRDLLEDLAARHLPAGKADKSLEALPAAQRSHAATCWSCREAAQDLVDAQEIFRVIPRQAAEPGPWFASRVMAAIAAREEELSEAARAWLAVPKLASRVSLASAALLLVASTWLYEKAARPLQQSPSGSTINQEYIFEAPQPPPNQDDVLISMAEENR